MHRNLQLRLALAIGITMLATSAHADDQRLRKTRAKNPALIAGGAMTGIAGSW